jgi:MFS family permease
MGDSRRPPRAEHNDEVSRPETTDGLWAPERRALTIGLVMTITIIASEALSVVTIMPVVARDLGGLRLYGWVFSAFMLASLVGIVAAGRQADRRGPAQPYLVGLALFGGGLIVSGLAPTMAILVVGRTLQGLGAGAIPAVAYVAIGRSLPDRLRPRMMAVLATGWVLPGVFGPAIAAQVARHVSWRWVFLGLVPLVLAAGPLALPALLRLGRVARPAAGETETTETSRTTTADGEHRLVDAIRTAAGAGLVLAGLTIAQPLALVALAAVGSVIGVPALRRLLPAGSLSGRRGLPATILTRGLLTFAFFGADAFVTLAITTVRHRSPTFASIAVTAATMTWTAGAWTQAHFGTRLQGRHLVRGGLFIILVGIAAMAAALRPPVPVEVAIAAWSLAGFGIGLAYTPLTLMMLREAPVGREGWASASLNLSDVLGTALGVGIGGAAVAIASGPGQTLATGITVAFGVAAAGAVAAVFLAGRLPEPGVTVVGDAPVSDVGPSSRPPGDARSPGGGPAAIFPH